MEVLKDTGAHRKDIGETKLDHITHRNQFHTTSVNQIVQYIKESYRVF